MCDPVLGHDRQVVSKLTGDGSGAHVPDGPNIMREVPCVRSNGPPPIEVCANGGCGYGRREPAGPDGLLLSVVKGVWP